MIFDSIQSMVGNTPLVRFKLESFPKTNIFIKLESNNPTGSIKDRACLYNIRGAEKNGQLTKRKTLLDASSGNMACALAFYGKLLGYKVKVICNSKLTADKRQYIEYFGAELDVFGDYTIEGNRKCHEIVSTSDGSNNYCFLDQLHNPNNPKASYETLGQEILTDLPDVSAIVGSMGSGGSMCGTARYIKEYSSSTKIFTSQAASGTKIPGTGAFVDGDYITPFIKEITDTPLQDDSFFINLDDAIYWNSQLALQGIFGGFQAGGVLYATISAIKKYSLVGNIVAIIGDSGWKNMDKLNKHKLL
jgi:cysteine synthase